MSYAVLLLCLVLVGPAFSQSTTESAAASGVSIIQNEDKATSANPVTINDDNATEIEDREEGEDVEPMKTSETQDRFSFRPADAKAWAKTSDFAQEGEDGEDPEDPTANLFKELTSLVDAEVQLMNSGPSNDTETTVTKIKDDNDSEEEGEDEDDEILPADDEEQSSDSKPEESQIKRQDEINPFGENKPSSLDFDQPNRKGEIPATPDVYVNVNDQPDISNPENDNSPLLQLTQGGYRSPYVFDTGIPRMRSQSASQQSETVENPSSNVNNDDQFRQPQISPQVSYADPFQSQFAFGSALGLRHPFMQPDSYANSNGMVQQPAQNGFFNMPHSGFPDFTGANFQTPFSPSNDGGYQALPRNPSGIPLFQTQPEHVAQNPGFMIQNQQFPQSQFLATDPTQATPTFYQTTGYMNYPENGNAAPRPDYSSFFRSSSPNNLQFQLNSNPFAPPRSAAGVLYNPMMQFQPNFPNRPQYSPQYPAPNQQVQVQTIATDEKGQKDLDKIAEGETTKTEKQVNTSPTNEDSTVPFGARIQRQNGPEPQSPQDSDFPPQADVYMRYPVKEAGYATEESLPVQNTTTKTEIKSESSPPRPIFSLFQGPGQFGDPYRNALNSVQGLAVDSRIRNEGESNLTKMIQPEQIPLQIAYPFSQPDLSRPIPGYPGSRNPDSPPMRHPAFFRAIDGPATDPYEHIALFPDHFTAPLQTDIQPQGGSELPACVHGQANASICFEDPEYPKRDVLFALNSDSYLMDRFSMPDQQLDTITLVEQDRLEHPESPANYICNSDIRYGFPLRAKDVNGQWKVIVNIEKDVGQGRFVQPVRLEICKGAGDPCNFTQVKTACVQKYSLHRMLSWSAEKGIHNDVFKLPVACSCQLIDAQA